MHNAAEDLLLIGFTKFVPLRTFADTNCFQDEISIYFVGNRNIALELRTVSQFILKSLGYDNTVYSNYTCFKYSNNLVIIGTFSGHFLLPHY